MHATSLKNDRSVISPSLSLACLATSRKPGCFSFFVYSALLARVK